MLPAFVSQQNYLQTNTTATMTVNPGHTTKRGHAEGSWEDKSQAKERSNRSAGIKTVVLFNSDSPEGENIKILSEAPESFEDNGHGDSFILKIKRVTTPERGRILMADSFFPKGAILFAVSPQASVCDTDSRRTHCGSCLRPIRPSEGDSSDYDSNDSDSVNNSSKKDRSTKNTVGMECEDCHEIWYCQPHPRDRDCKRLDWEDIHRFECQFLRQLYQGPCDSYSSSGNNVRLQEYHQNAIDRFRFLDGYDQDYCRVLIRVLVHRFKEYSTQDHGVEVGRQKSSRINKEEVSALHRPRFPLPYAAVMEMVDNKERVSAAKIEGTMMDVARILDAFQEHMYQQHPNRAASRNVPGLTLDELLSLVLKEESNSFGLYAYPTVPAQATNDNPPAITTSTPKPCSNAKQGYGLGLFVDQYTNFFNHSCTPNIFHVARNSQLLFYAGRDIRPGEELNITYLELGPQTRIPVELNQHGQDGNDRKAALEGRRRALKEFFYFDCSCDRCAWEAFHLGHEQAHPSSRKAANSRVKLSQEEENFMREGLICGRAGCFGFYAPPEVLNALDRFYDGSDQWCCVACGHQQL
ncbi:hypothetical protein BGX28_007172 [Mortierella sp. GBA30]|nr:hypothetical protein BGX28_007172 [Mortierella sp. GBA30]